MKVPKLVLFPLVFSLLISILSLVCVIQLNNKAAEPANVPTVDIQGQVSSEVAIQVKAQVETAINSALKPVTESISALDTRLTAAEKQPTTAPTVTQPPAVTQPEAKPTTPVSTKQVKVTTGLNLRTKPGTTQTIAGALNNGDSVTYLNESANADGYNWIKVKTASGATGWIAKDFVTDK